MCHAHGFARACSARHAHAKPWAWHTTKRSRRSQRSPRSWRSCRSSRSCRSRRSPRSRRPASAVCRRSGERGVAQVGQFSNGRISLPPPLWGRALFLPPPLRGGLGWGVPDRGVRGASSLPGGAPPTPALPHKGGGSRKALPALLALLALPALPAFLAFLAFPRAFEGFRSGDGSPAPPARGSSRGVPRPRLCVGVPGRARPRRAVGVAHHKALPALPTFPPFLAFLSVPAVDSAVCGRPESPDRDRKNNYMYKISMSHEARSSPGAPHVPAVSTVCRRRSPPGPRADPAHSPLNLYTQVYYLSAPFPEISSPLPAAGRRGGGRTRPGYVGARRDSFLQLRPALLQSADGPTQPITRRKLPP